MDSNVQVPQVTSDQVDGILIMLTLIMRGVRLQELAPDMDNDALANLILDLILASPASSATGGEA